MGRKPGSINIKVKTEPKYQVIVRNPFECTESSKDFTTMESISEYFKSIEVELTIDNISNYITGRSKPPLLISFRKIT